MSDIGKMRMDSRWMLIAIAGVCAALVLACGCEVPGDNTTNETLITAEDGSTVIIVDGQNNSNELDQSSRTEAGSK